MVLFALHISDGVLSFPWIAAGFAVMAILVAISLFRIREDLMVRLGLFTAAFFVASQVHIPVGLGTVHLLLTAVVGIVLRRLAPLAICEAIVLDSFLRGHGGQYAIGVNTCVMSIPALMAGYLYPWVRRWLSSYQAGALVGFVATILSLLLYAGVLMWGGQEEWDTLVGIALVAHIPVIIVEMLLTGIIVSYLEIVKPEWMPPRRQSDSSSGKISSNGISH